MSNNVDKDKKKTDSNENLRKRKQLESPSYTDSDNSFANTPGASSSEKNESLSQWLINFSPAEKREIKERLRNASSTPSRQIKHQPKKIRNINKDSEFGEKVNKEVKSHSETPGAEKIKMMVVESKVGKVESKITIRNQNNDGKHSVKKNGEQNTCQQNAVHEKMDQEDHTDEEGNKGTISSKFAGQNKFEVLSTLEQDEQYDDMNSRNTRSSNRTNDEQEIQSEIVDDLTQRSTPSKKQTQTDSKHRRKTTAARNRFTSKLPPINIYNGNTKNVISWLNEKIDNNNFVLNNFSTVKSVLKVRNLETFDLALEILKQNKVDFFTRTPKERKIYTFLLKGIVGDFDEKDIEQELTNLNLDSVIITKIQKINTKTFFKAKRGGDAFLVQLPGTAKVSNLLKVDRLASQVIRWDRVSRKDGVQCKNCQRIGHVAKYCNRQYRCVKCSEKHEPGNCQMNGTDDGEIRDFSKLFCVHCNSYGHPASYRGCPKLKETQDKIKERIHNTKLQRQDKFAKIANYINPALSYAKAVSSNNKEESSSRTVNDNINDQTAFLQNKIETILDAFKTSFMTFITGELVEIKRAVQQNAENIQILFNANKTQNGPYDK